jgi:hypothetical protein
MVWDIPNYDSLKIAVAPELDEVDDGWEVETLQLDLEELEQTLPSRR